MASTPPPVRDVTPSPEEQDEWRTSPGYVFEVLKGDKPCRFYHSRYAQYQCLLGAFLFSSKPSPLTDRPLFGEPGYRWGVVPLEKVIWDEAHLNRLALSPFVSRNSVSIIEPCQFVGYTPHAKRGVRASKNVAYHLQMVSDCDSVLFPLWHSGVGSGPGKLPIEFLVPVVSASRGVIVEGGYGTVYDPSSFPERLPLEDMIFFVQNLVLNRFQMRAPSIYICLGHQLVYEGITRLVIQVVDEVRKTVQEYDDAGKELPLWLSALKDTVAKIDRVGTDLAINCGTHSIRGYRSRQFTVTPNDTTEIGSKRLCPFETPVGRTVPPRLMKAHKLTEHRYDQHSLLSTIMRKYGVTLQISMFHGDRVNYEAVLFDNWALSTLHTHLVVHRNEVVRSPLSWVLNLPCGMEVCASTSYQTDDGVTDHMIHTAVAATSIFYEDFETTTVKSSFTLQFHPELCDGIKVVGDVDSDGKVYQPDFETLKKSDGVQLLIRMLHVNSQIS